MSQPHLYLTIRKIFHSFTSSSSELRESCKMPVLHTSIKSRGGFQNLSPFRDQTTRFHTQSTSTSTVSHTSTLTRTLRTITHFVLPSSSLRCVDSLARLHPHHLSSWTSIPPPLRKHTSTFKLSQWSEQTSGTTSKSSLYLISTTRRSFRSGKLPNTSTNVGLAAVQVPQALTTSSTQKRRNICKSSTSSELVQG
jgi:hypothetical protein